MSEKFVILCAHNISRLQVMCAHTTIHAWIQVYTYKYTYKYMHFCACVRGCVHWCDWGVLVYLHGRLPHDFYIVYIHCVRVIPQNWEITISQG